VKTSNAMVVLLAVLLLAGMIVSPISAYTQLSTYTYSTGSANNTVGAYWVTNSSASQNWTQVTYIETTLYDTSTESHTYSGLSLCKDPSTKIGTAEISYSAGSNIIKMTTTFTTASGFSSFFTYVGSTCGGSGYMTLSGFNERLDAQDFGYQNLPYGAAMSYIASNWLARGTTQVYGGSSVVAPVASFACTPTSQYPDSDVVCTDTSTNTPTSWLWSIDMEGAGIYGWQTHTGQNFTWESHYPGLYSVNLQATNAAGSDWENKSNYVSISLNATPNNCNLPVASGYIRTYAQTNDGMTSGGIYSSQIQMRDMEGGAWSNTTSSEGYWCIDTLPGHSLNLYAQATGYTSTSQLGVSANGGRYYLVLWPDYIPAPSAGNVSLYVLVYDQQTGSPLYLSSVRVDGNNINTYLKNTGPEGQAIFTIKNNTAIHVTASKAGYNTITRTMTTSNLGPDTLMISLPRATETPTITATTGPGGTVPTTIGPYGTPGPGGTMAPGYTNNQGQLMMDFLARNGLSLVELCFFVTVLALLGVKLGK
jgi:PKD repeat protein